MELAERIRKRRLELGLSSKFIAEKVGVAPSTYFEWEQGREIKGVRPYIQLAEILRMSLAELLTGQGHLSEVEKEIRAIEEHVKNIRRFL